MVSMKPKGLPRNNRNWGKVAEAGPLQMESHHVAQVGVQVLDQRLDPCNVWCQFAMLCDIALKVWLI